MSGGSGLVRGHTLQYEGAPHRADGSRIGGYYGGVGGNGHGKCSCGALGPLTSSGAARKEWHRRHKDRIAAVLAAQPTTTEAS